MSSCCSLLWALASQKCYQSGHMGCSTRHYLPVVYLGPDGKKVSCIRPLLLQVIIHININNNEGTIQTYILTTAVQSLKPLYIKFTQMCSLANFLITVLWDNCCLAIEGEEPTKRETLLVSSNSEETENQNEISPNFSQLHLISTQQQQELHEKPQLKITWSSSPCGTSTHHLQI